MKEPEHVFIGYDSREDIAAKVCAFSIQRRSTVPLLTEFINWNVLGYDRPHKVVDGQMIDKRDRRPFSTEFTFARFLVPWLQSYEGWALFCDCDFLFLEDVAKLFALRDESKAVMVVQRLHLPAARSKMDGKLQIAYPRKNWSSLILWNCSHPENRVLTLDVVNHMPGRMLHGFKWLEDRDIGRLSAGWNHLVGYDEPTIPIRALHYTEGGPWFPAYEDCKFSEEWKAERDLYVAKRLPKEIAHGTSREESHGAV